MTSTDPTLGWQQVREFYIEFAALPGFTYLSPMIEFVEWVSRQSFAGRLYPSTSHAALNVKLVPGYNPGTPGIMVELVQGVGFEFTLYSPAAKRVVAKFNPGEEAQTAFAGFVSRLESLQDNPIRPSKQHTETPPESVPCP